MIKKKRRLNIGKIIFLLVILFVAYIMFVPDFSENNSYGANNHFSSLESQKINKVMLDDNLHLQFILLSFDPVLKIIDTEQLFPVSDFYYLKGKLENKNDKKIYCDLNVLVNLNEIKHNYEDNLLVNSLSTKNFKILIELPDGESDIKFSYNCKLEN